MSADDELRDRLERAEAIVGALRRDEVDAVVGVHGPALLRLREVEDALLRSEARYRAIVEDQSELICRCQPDLRLSFVNQAFCRYFGCEPEQVVAQSLDSLVIPEDRERAIEHWHSLGSARPAGSIELRVQPGAEPRWLHFTDRAIVGEQGEVLELQSVGRDVTHRVMAEHELRRLNAELEQRVEQRTAEAEQRMIAMRAMALEMTQAEDRERRRLAQFLHDHLQQQLVGIRMLVRRSARRTSVEGLQQELEQVEALVTEAIGSSRSLAAELSPPVLHQEGLPAALEWLAARMRESQDLEVELSVAPEADPADARLRVFLFQAARELLFNVVKHAGEGAARLAAEVADGAIRITVSDRGRGFEPRALEDEDGAPAGFGLLSIRERAQVLGGRLEILSGRGEGSRLSVEVPCVRSGRPESPATEAQEVPVSGGGPLRRSLRVLVADDHRVLRDGLRAVLEDEVGIEVVGEARTGAEAVELAGQLRPDVVIMDLAMPDMDGIEATRQIKEAQPGVRVIGLSMFDRARLRDEIIAAGAEMLLSKAEPIETVVDAVLGLHEGTTARR